MICAGVCSGISAPAVAWAPLGFEWAFEAEIEAFPSAVLEHHRPQVPNYGDMTHYRRWPDAAIDILIGGTPCQSFSLAGLRAGMDDPRGNLALTFIGLVDRYRPRWVVWENVPGVLSSGGGRDFESFIRGMAEIGYYGAWRVLDAQWFGVAQRRRRVFAVFCAGDWRRAAAVLFEPEGLRGDTAPSREAGQKPAPTLGDCSNGGGANGPGRSADTAESLIPEPAGTLGGSSQDGGFRTTDLDNTGAFVPEISPALKARDSKGPSSDGDGDGAPLVALPDTMPTLRAGSPNGGTGHGARSGDSKDEYIVPEFSFKASHYTRGKDGAPADITPPLSAEADKGDQDCLVFQPRIARNGHGQPSRVAHALTSESGQGDSAPCVFGFAQNQRNEVREVEVAGALAAQPGMKQQTFLNQAAAVRRLTPRECERLQGFPDDYTRIPWRGKAPSKCPDGPRYKALGNSMAVPVVRWIGERIALFDSVFPDDG